MRMHALAERGLSKFVGRQDEIEEAQPGCDASKVRDRAKWSRWSAKPGVGKSRIFLEFARSSDMQGWLILEGGSGHTARRHRIFR